MTIERAYWRERQRLIAESNFMAGREGEEGNGNVKKRGKFKGRPL
jgi:hypothetical protein